MCFKKIIIATMSGIAVMLASFSSAYASEDILTGLGVVKNFDAETGMVSIPMDLFSDDTQKAILTSYLQQISPGTSYEDFDDIFNAFASSALSNRDLGSDESFGSSACFQIDAGKIYGDVNDAADYSLVNAKYDSASQKLSEFSEEYSSKIIDPGSGNSVFKDVYGEMTWDIDMSGYTIPESFNADESAKSIGDSIMNAYNSNDYVNSIASSIDIESVFGAASQPVSMPSLQSYESLKSMASDAGSILKENSQSKYADDVSFIQGTGNAQALYDGLNTVIADAENLRGSTTIAFNTNKSAYGQERPGNESYDMDDILEMVSNVNAMQPVEGGSIISGFEDNNGAGALMLTPFDGIHIDGFSWIDGQDLLYTGYDGVTGSVIDAKTGYTYTDQQVMALSQVRVPITEIAPYIVDGTFTFSDPDSDEAKYWTGISQNIVDKNLTIDARGNLVEKAE